MRNSTNYNNLFNPCFGSGDKMDIDFFDVISEIQWMFAEQVGENATEDEYRRGLKDVYRSVFKKYHSDSWEMCEDQKQKNTMQKKGHYLGEIFPLFEKVDKNGKYVYKISDFMKYDTVVECMGIRDNLRNNWNEVSKRVSRINENIMKNSAYLDVESIYKQLQDQIVPLIGGNYFSLEEANRRIDEIVDEVKRKYNIDLEYRKKEINMDLYRDAFHYSDDFEEDGYEYAEDGYEYEEDERVGNRVVSVRQAGYKFVSAGIGLCVICRGLSNLYSYGTILPNASSLTVGVLSLIVCADLLVGANDSEHRLIITKVIDKIKSRVNEERMRNSYDDFEERAGAYHR